MAPVKDGDNVHIHYTGSLPDGSVFDSSEGRDPLAFTVGSGQIIPGLDKALPGMEVGEKKRVEIPPEEAYGAHNPDGVLEVPRAEIPAEIPLEAGLRLEMRTPQGQPVPVTVTEVTETTVTLDSNHFLAGKTLVFEFEVVAVS